MKNSRLENSGSILTKTVGRMTPRPGIIFGLIILAALVAFEVFNFSTTDFALKDLLGDLSFAGIRWATILAVAFCSIDFAGIARLFAPYPNGEEPGEAWYLFGAWFLAATMNAILTWWGVSLAIANHALRSTTVVDPDLLTTAVPVFVALMVWVIRILVIGSLTVASRRLLEGERRPTSLPVVASRARTYTTRPTPLPSARHAARPAQPAAARQMASAAPVNRPSIANRPEPTYHSLTRSARPSNQDGQPGSGSTRRM